MDNLSVHKAEGILRAIEQRKAEGREGIYPDRKLSSSLPPSADSPLHLAEPLRI